MHVILDRIEILSPKTKTFWFTPERMPYYIAGQFVELTLPQVPEHSRNRRWFTLSSAPTEPQLAITTYFDTDHLSPYKQALQDLRPGDTAIMSEPMGDFVLPLSKATPILYVAGGMGITPLRSMLQWLIDTNQQRDISLLYAAHTSEDFLYKELFESYGLTPSYLTSEVPIDEQHEQARIDVERVLREYTDGFIFIAGPEPMTEELVYDLKDKKISATKLVTDYFPGYAKI